MSYATQETLEDLFGEEALILLTGGDTAPDPERLQAALEAADAEVNGYLQGVVELPLTGVPDTIRHHASGIAYYHLAPDNPSEGAEKRYKSAIRYLERVQDGKASLGLTDGGAGTGAEPFGEVQAAPATKDFHFDGYPTNGFTG